MLRYNYTSASISLRENKRVAERHEEIVTYSKNCDVLFVYKEWNNLYDNQILELKDFNQIRALSMDTLEKADLKKILDTRKEKSNDVVVYLPGSLEDSEQIVNEVSKEIGGKQWSLILEDDHAVYYIDM